MMCWQVRVEVPTLGTQLWRSSAIKGGVQTVTILEMVAWGPVWMSAGNSWVRLCLSVRRVT